MDSYAIFAMTRKTVVVSSKKLRVVWAGVLLCLLGMLGVLVANFFVFSFNQPNHEELAVEATAIARVMRIDQPPERYDHTGAVFEDSMPEQRVSARLEGRPSEVFDRLVHTIESRGYNRIEDYSPNSPLEGSWRKGRYRVTAGVYDTYGDGVQLVDVGISVKPYRKSY